MATEAAAQSAKEAESLEQAETSRRETAAADKSDAELLAELNLPDPESLKLGDDLTAFLKKEVPERLRRRALRRFWRTNPVLACLDGLNDYDGDFTNAATDAPGVATAYRVGKGMLHHIETLARESAQANVDKEDEKISAETAEITDISDEFVNNAVIQDHTQETPIAAPASTTKVAMSEPVIGEKIEPQQEFAAQPRRMRFRFGTETG
ncbi:DUF3306 domain-containing protein [Puniceibacterium sp. IMCC21224]|uniref:DUF3306 domain-containing protein n=1 Tax=Puniceibacterium sp. IMCC21224 TaxID=1618204 RepID=UPI001E437577